jgi:hypothetical protein
VTELVQDVPSFKRAKLVGFLATFVLLMAGAVVTAPPASAHYCNHESHWHAHADHQDYYHWHDHYNEFGTHFHTWHNHTHSYTFSTQC